MNHETTEFNLIWENDYDLYHAVIAYARELLNRVPGMTDQTLGRNVKDRVFAWAYGGGWGWDDTYPHNPRAFDYFLPRDAYGMVSEEAIAEDVREILVAED